MSGNNPHRPGPYGHDHDDRRPRQPKGARIDTHDNHGDRHYDGSNAHSHQRYDGSRPQRPRYRHDHEGRQDGQEEGKDPSWLGAVRYSLRGVEDEDCNHLDMRQYDGLIASLSSLSINTLTDALEGAYDRVGAPTILRPPLRPTIHQRGIQYGSAYPMVHACGSGSASTSATVGGQGGSNERKEGKGKGHREQGPPTTSPKTTLDSLRDDTHDPRRNAGSSTHRTTGPHTTSAGGSSKQASNKYGSTPTNPNSSSQTAKDNGGEASTHGKANGAKGQTGQAAVGNKAKDGAIKKKRKMD